MSNENLVKMLEIVNNNIMEIKSDIKEIKDNHKIINEKILIIENKQEEQENEILNLQETVKTQSEQINMFEKLIKKCNIIMKGVKETLDEKPQEIMSKTVAIINNNLNLDTKLIVDDLVEVRRLGVKEEGKDRAILMQLKSVDKKQEINKKRYQFKGSNIFIENDLTSAQIKIKKDIYTHYKNYKNEGVDIKIDFNGQFLLYKTIKYNVQNLAQLEKVVKKSEKNKVEASMRTFRPRNK